MEQARCLMMAKQTQNLVDDDSWEERAFAEDAAGLLGGCVWPPRSYTCSFCAREFRSAQALGGHMNVHRRDRAKLKQLSSSCNHNQILNTNPNRLDYCTNNHLLSYSYLTFTSPTCHQSQDSCSFICNNPNLDSSQLGINGSKQSLLPPSQVIHKRKPTLSTYDLEIISNNNKEIDHTNGNHHEKPNSFVCLDLGKNSVTMVDGYEEDDLHSNKRRKVDIPSQLFMSKSTDKGKVDYYRSSKIDTDDLKSNSIEDLDLELRLGV